MQMFIRLVIFLCSINGLSSYNFITHHYNPHFHLIEEPKNEVTLSGFSSGGTFAQQMLIAYPEIVKGIAVFSHTYYRCGPPSGNRNDYDKQCTAYLNTPKEELYNPEKVHEDIQLYESQKLIGDTKLLKDKKLYVYTGLRNIIFNTDMALAVLKVFERYIQNPKAVRTRVQNTQLVMPTNNNGPLCSTNVGLPDMFIGNCGFSGAFEALNFLLENKVWVEPKPDEKYVLEALKQFNQEEFTFGIENHNMDTKGYYYVPKNCQKIGSCPVHFFFHGCRTGRDYNGPMFVEKSGYLEVAELNNIVMIFPQAVLTPELNPSGCWDTFGLSGPLYATNQGAQVTAVKRMIDKIFAKDYTFLGISS